MERRRSQFRPRVQAGRPYRSGQFQNTRVHRDLRSVRGLLRTPVNERIVQRLAQQAQEGDYQLTPVLAQRLALTRWIPQSVPNWLLPFLGYSIYMALTGTDPLGAVPEIISLAGNSLVLGTAPALGLAGHALSGLAPALANVVPPWVLNSAGTYISQAAPRVASSVASTFRRWVDLPLRRYTGSTGLSTFSGPYEFHVSQMPALTSDQVPFSIEEDSGINTQFPRYSQSVVYEDGRRLPSYDYVLQTEGRDAANAKFRRGLCGPPN